MIGPGHRTAPADYAGVRMEADVFTRARSFRGRAGGERPERSAFVGVFVAALLAFLGLGAVLPVLPQYVKGPIGAGDVAVGLVTRAFAFTAVLCRPLAGRIAHPRRRPGLGVGGAPFAPPPRRAPFPPPG